MLSERKAWRVAAEMDFSNLGKCSKYIEEVSIEKNIGPSICETGKKRRMYTQSLTKLESEESRRGTHAKRPNVLEEMIILLLFEARKEKKKISKF